MRTLIPREVFSRINFGKLFRYAIYLLLSLILQNILLTQLRLAGVCPLIVPAVSVAVGMFEGATWGPLFSLILGIFTDMAFVENQPSLFCLYGRGCCRASSDRSGAVAEDLGC